MRRRVLVLTRDVIPLAGRSVSGGGLRAWGLGEALKMAGHDVVYSVPQTLVPEGEEYDGLRQLAFDAKDLHTTLLKAEPDVLLLEQWGLATHLGDTSLPVILDLHGSLILENAFRKHRSLTSNAAAKIKALQKADLVLCPGSRQRGYFMAWLMMSGADPTDIPVEVIPVSMPPEQPQRTADLNGPLTMVYGGQLWPWIEPGNALIAATEVLEETGAGTLNLFVSEPEQQVVLPYDDSTKMQAWALPQQVKSSGVVKMEGRVPRDAMLDRYAGAHLAVDVYSRNTERELAFTTRTVEYMWCGLPVLYGNYGELAEMIAHYEAGWVVPPDDRDQIRAAISEAVSDRKELARRSENARRLVREKLSWDRTGGPLDRFVKDPMIRPKGETIFGRLALEFDRLKTEGDDRIVVLEEDVKHLVAEVGNRDSRILALTDELAHRERQADESAGRHRAREDELRTEGKTMETLLSRHTIELAEREREIRQLRRAQEEDSSGTAKLQAKLARALEELQCEQSDHTETSRSLETLLGELAQVRRDAAEQGDELDRVKTDLKGALAKIAQQSETFSAKSEELEQRARELANLEQELRQDLAAEATNIDQLKLEIEQGNRERERMVEQIKDLVGRLRDMSDNWIQRSMATGQYSFKRVAMQVPTVAGLFVRNLANNAYMTVWQKRHNIRIFPGQ